MNSHRSEPTDPTETMSRTKKQPDVREYRLLIAPRFDEREQKYKTLVLLETAKIFASFRYELSVKEERAPQQLRYTVLGLKTPQLSLPTAGHAQFSRTYEDLNGTFDVSVRGLDGNVNTFSVRIRPERVELLKSPQKRFVDFVTGNAEPSTH